MTRDTAYDSGLIVGLVDGEHVVFDGLQEGQAANAAISRAGEFSVPDDCRQRWQLGYVEGYVRAAKENR